MIADPAHGQPPILAVIETVIRLAEDRTVKKNRRRCEGDSVLAPVDDVLDRIDFDGDHEDKLRPRRSHVQERVRLRRRLESCHGCAEKALGSSYVLRG